LGEEFVHLDPTSGKKKIAGDDVKIPQENVIDRKPSLKLLGRGGTEICLSFISKELNFKNKHISAKNKIYIF